MDDLRLGCRNKVLRDGVLGRGLGECRKRSRAGPAMARSEQTLAKTEPPTRSWVVWSPSACEDNSASEVVLVVLVMEPALIKTIKPMLILQSCLPPHGDRSSVVPRRRCLLAPCCGIKQSSSFTPAAANCRQLSHWPPKTHPPAPNLWSRRPIASQVLMIINIRPDCPTLY